ncbi:MAG: hypothetical protein NWR72_04030 [Bacteroidia bacterium]|nr:hypothetical protein [Bacteroidia bacterium]
MNQFAPIAIFAFNRPDHTRRTLEALSLNPEAAHSTLYIFADGPKAGISPEKLAEVHALRDMIREKKWCKDVIIKESPVNKGLAKSISEGVTEIVNLHGKIIVLEDDIVTAPGFLKFMNEALDFYEKEDKVMHISGYVPDMNRKKLPETFFLTFMSCWGWATWDTAWKAYQEDSAMLYRRLLSERKLETFNLGGAIKFSNYLKGNLTGKHNSWAIKWFASIFFNRGLCLYPRQSLVQNIGFDGTGSHYNQVSTRLDPMTVRELLPAVDIDFKQPILENQQARKALTHFYKYQNDYSATNILRVNARWIKQRMLFLKDYLQPPKALHQHANSSRIHA